MWKIVFGPDIISLLLESFIIDVILIPLPFVSYSLQDNTGIRKVKKNVHKSFLHINR